LIAAGRCLTAREVDRTVLHEIEGHVLPALSRSLGTVTTRLRPAGDSDAEEGRALALEREHGWLDANRRKELGMRHLAAVMAHEGATFEEIADKLDTLSADVAQAVRIAIRALRGGGLGRERVYLPALFRIARS
jgi:hypothetical protein